MRKLIIDARIRSFADDYKTKLQNQCPDIVSDLRALSNFVSSNNTFKDATVGILYFPVKSMSTQL